MPDAVYPKGKPGLVGTMRMHASPAGRVLPRNDIPMRGSDMKQAYDFVYCDYPYTEKEPTSWNPVTDTGRGCGGTPVDPVRADTEIRQGKYVMTPEGKPCILAAWSPCGGQDRIRGPAGRVAHNPRQGRMHDRAGRESRRSVLDGHMAAHPCRERYGCICFKAQERLPARGFGHAPDPAA